MCMFNWQKNNTKLDGPDTASIDEIESKIKKFVQIEKVKIKKV